jgi:O-antigen ligase
VQSLVLRPGFLHRFALVSFGIGLLTMPYTRFVTDNGAFRLALDRTVGFSNSNDLGAWFGFCCVYFITVVIESRRPSVRIISLGCVLISLTILGLTVSRGPLISVAVATVTALRRVLKRGFVPVLILCAGLAFAYGFGLFDKIVDYYTARSMVESGRLVAWPRVLPRILSSPLVGWGISNVGTFVPEQGISITPHNAYLFFPLSSGIVPSVFFMAYLARAAWRSAFCQDDPQLRADQPFRIPLLVYVALSCLTLDYPFLANWALVSLCIAMSVVEPATLIGRGRFQPRSQRPLERSYA